MTGQAFPQDNRIEHKNMKQSKQAIYCSNLSTNAQILCFNKLTGEHNTKKYFKILSFCASIFLMPKSGVSKTVDIHFNKEFFLLSTCPSNIDYTVQKSRHLHFDTFISQFYSI